MFLKKWKQHVKCHASEALFSRFTEADMFQGQECIRTEQVELLINQNEPKQMTYSSKANLDWESRNLWYKNF